MVYTRNGTRNIIFGFAVSCLNFDLNAVNFLQKLKKYIKCIKSKFSRLLQEDETRKFNQACSKTRLRHRARASARCEFNPNIVILIG